MNVLLISANTEQINMVTLPLGLVCVATATKAAGHDVKLVDLLAQTEPRSIVRDAIREFHPDVIGISVRNIDDQAMENKKFLLSEVKDFVDECRKHSNAPIVLGGAGYSIFPESTLVYLGADAGIQGEGEIIFPALLEKLQQGMHLSEIPGIYIPGRGLQRQRTFARELDVIPFPDEHLWSVSHLNNSDILIPIQTRRGCGLGCNYCSTATIEGEALRKRSPEAVVEGITRHVAAGYRNFYFTDNTFNIPGSYALQLCRRLMERKLEISWTCIVYP
ncbi:MAG: cobalamin-dependent protein, partial [Proteobacteria bacterium]|nr:cobalamin-dependent protein [Pseudomonadota bacterium]